MARSLKKGPFADAQLAEESRRYECSRTETGYQDLVPSFHNLPVRWLDTQSQFMTEESMFRYTLLRIWLDTNSVSS